MMTMTAVHGDVVGEDESMGEAIAMLSLLGDGEYELEAQDANYLVVKQSGS